MPLLRPRTTIPFVLAWQSNFCAPRAYSLNYHTKVRLHKYSWDVVMEDDGGSALEGAIEMMKHALGTGGRSFWKYSNLVRTPVKRKTSPRIGRMREAGFCKFRYLVGHKTSKSLACEIRVFLPIYFILLRRFTQQLGVLMNGN